MALTKITQGVIKPDENYKTGIITATHVAADTIGVAGTLTYEDVTSVDSIGIITARDGIDVTGGDLTLVHSAPKITLKDTDGTSQNSQIFQTGGSLFVDTRNNTFDGAFIMRGQGGGTGTEKLRINGLGNVGIGTDNPTAKLDVNGTVNVSGISTFSDDAYIGSNNSSGVILTSPNGTQYRLIVANDGTLSTTSV